MCDAEDRGDFHGWIEFIKKKKKILNVEICSDLA